MCDCEVMMKQSERVDGDGEKAQGEAREVIS